MEPLLRNGKRRVSNEFLLRPTRDPSARRKRLTPDAKHPSSHPRLRRPKGTLCFTHRPPRIRKSVRSSNGDCSRRRHQASRIETADRRRQASLTLALRSGSETRWRLVHFRKVDARVSHAEDYTTSKLWQFAVVINPWQHGNAVPGFQPSAPLPRDMKRRNRIALAPSRMGNSLCTVCTWPESQRTTHQLARSLHKNIWPRPS